MTQFWQRFLLPVTTYSTPSTKRVIRMWIQTKQWKIIRIQFSIVTNMQLYMHVSWLHTTIVGTISNDKSVCFYDTTRFRSDFLGMNKVGIHKLSIPFDLGLSSDTQVHRHQKRRRRTRVSHQRWLFHYKKL